METLNASVNIEERKTCNFCTVYRSGNLRFVRFLELMESFLVILRRLKSYGFISKTFLQTGLRISEQRQYNNLQEAHEFCSKNYSPTLVTLTSSTFRDQVIASCFFSEKTLSNLQ